MYRFKNGAEQSRDLCQSLEKMVPIAPVAIHANDGLSFVGVRVRRDGRLEIVFDRFGSYRSIWEVVAGNVSLDGLREACSRAILAQDCMATLHAALASAGVRIECVEERNGHSAAP